jgi:hypothetical protein
MPTFGFQRLNPAYQSDPRRIMGQALAQQGASTAPVRTPLQGLGRLSSALVGAYLQRNALDAQAQREAQASEALMGMLPENVSPQVRAAVRAAPGSFEPAIMASMLQPTTTSSLVDQGDMAFVQNKTTTPLTGAENISIGSVVQRRAAPVTYTTLTDEQAKAAGFDTSKGQRYQRSTTGLVKQIGSTPAVTNVTVDMAKESGKSVIEKFENLETAASASRTAVSNADRMLALLDEGIQTGFGAEAGLTFQKIGQFFNPDYAVKDVAGRENFLSAANELVLPRVKQLGYNPTDADLRFINQASPQLSKSIAGNKLMLQTIRIVEARNIALFDEANRFIQSSVTAENPNGIMGDPMGRFKLGQHLSEFAKTNPLFTESTATLQAEFERITGTPASTVQPTSVVDDLITRGLITE